MNQHNQNHLSMWKAVRNLLKKYEAVWRGNLPFSNAVDALSSYIDAADAGIKAQGNKTTGITKDKTALEEIAVEKVVAIAKCATAYALNKGDNTLYAAMNYTSYSLLRLPQNEVPGRLRNILEAAEMVAGQLGAYGVAPNDFADAEAAIVAYEAITPLARTTVSDRVSVGKGFPQIKNNVKLELEKMDNLIHVFNNVEPRLEGAYKSARVIVDAGTRHDDNNTPPPPTH